MMDNLQILNEPLLWLSLLVIVISGAVTWLIRRSPGRHSDSRVRQRGIADAIRGIVDSPQFLAELHAVTRMQIASEAALWQRAAASAQAVLEKAAAAYQGACADLVAVQSDLSRTARRYKRYYAREAPQSVSRFHKAYWPAMGLLGGAVDTPLNLILLQGLFDHTAALFMLAITGAVVLVGMAHAVGEMTHDESRRRWRYVFTAGAHALILISAIGRYAQVQHDIQIYTLVLSPPVVSVVFFLMTTFAWWLAVYISGWVHEPIRHGHMAALQLVNSRYAAAEQIWVSIIDAASAHRASWVQYQDRVQGSITTFEYLARAYWEAHESIYEGPRIDAYGTFPELTNPDTVYTPLPMPPMSHSTVEQFEPDAEEPEFHPGPEEAEEVVPLATSNDVGEVDESETEPNGAEDPRPEEIRPVTPMADEMGHDNGRTPVIVGDAGEEPLS